MTPSKHSQSRSSFESIRKQAKKLLRELTAGNPAAIARVHAQLPVANLPVSLRDTQLVIARELGFAGWQSLREAILLREGKGLEWAASEAERAIHNNNQERLSHLIGEYPALLSWRGDFGESLLGAATGSFGDSGDPYREQMFTRLECAELLLDSGAVPDPSVWEGAIRSRAKGVLHLLSHRGLLPRSLDVLAATGDSNGIQENLARTNDSAEVEQAFLIACRFDQREIASLLLDRCIELDSTLGSKMENWRGRTEFIDYLIEHPQSFGSPWQTDVTPWLTVVMSELFSSIDDDNLPEFIQWLRREPFLLDESHVVLQVKLVEQAVLKDRGPFIAQLLEMDPAVLRAASPPQSSALEFALEYGHSHLMPMLVAIWPMPDDLCHAAGIGDFPRVKGWFDAEGTPMLGSLHRHYPTNSPSTLRNLHWTAEGAQPILDVALAWACINCHFEIAAFLLKHGADVNTSWSTHEPASILHECAVHANFEAAQFLIDNGIDLTIRDHRWNGTAEGWALHAAQDRKMSEFLANAERSRAISSP